MKPSLGKTIFKVAIGLICIVIGLDDAKDLSFFLFCFVIGAAFIAWGLIPYFEAKKKAKQEETEAILNAPFPGEPEEEEDEAERLARKYYKD